jgi:3,4-dihydroxy 2-butanone 4-phosphate synthase/GTP cyclohydrolase II
MSTKSEPILRPVSEAEFPSRYGDFIIRGFEYTITREPYVVLTKGEFTGDTSPLLRIHSQCLTGDVLGSLRCDCGEQLAEALVRIEEDGCGILIYQLQEGRGIGILNKLLAYELQDQGADTVEANEMLGFDADLRQYDACVQILKHFGICRVRIMSNNPSKIGALENGGITVEARIPLEMNPDQKRHQYLLTKKKKMGHLLENV